MGFILELLSKMMMEKCCGEIIRPLLEVRRRELESYLGKVRQSWREDATNLDTKFTRNRVRKLLVPLLENEFNPVDCRESVRVGRDRSRRGRLLG